MTINVQRMRAQRSALRIDLVRYLPSAVLLGYGGFILSLYLRGILTLYINPAYVWPTTLSGAVLLVLGVVKLARPASNSCCSTDTCCSSDSCDCGDSAPKIWPYLASAVPLLLAVLFPPRSLLAYSANQRGLQIAGLSAIHGATAVRHVGLSVNTKSFSLQDWVGALSSDPNPQDYLGKPIVLKGMALHNSAAVPRGFIMVLRYQVTCCIADARPEGLIVRDTSRGAIQDNQWVQVTGTMGKTSYQGQQVAVVNPKQIRPIKAGNPYMY